jgi:hypothetical protein
MGASGYPPILIKQSLSMFFKICKKMQNFMNLKVKKEKKKLKKLILKFD